MIRGTKFTSRFTDMPFPSINRTLIRCTDTLTHAKLLRFLGICQALALPHLSKCTINFTSLSPVSNPKTTFVACSIESRVQYAHSAWCFLPYQVRWGSNVGTVRQLLSVPEDECQTVTPSLHPVSHYPCLACGDCCLTFILRSEMNWNQSFYAQIHFQRLNHAWKGPLHYFYTHYQLNIKAY